MTGTNGKTTTTFWTASLLTALGSPSGIIGTVGVFFAGRQIPAPHLTTPDAASLQGILKDLEEAGAKSFVMEASSVGLDQGRTLKWVYSPICLVIIWITTRRWKRTARPKDFFLLGRV